MLLFVNLVSSLLGILVIFILLFWTKLLMIDPEPCLLCSADLGSLGAAYGNLAPFSVFFF